MELTNGKLKIENLQCGESSCSGSHGLTESPYQSKKAQPFATLAEPASS